MEVESWIKFAKVPFPLESKLLARLYMSKLLLFPKKSGVKGVSWNESGNLKVVMGIRISYQKATRKILDLPSHHGYRHRPFPPPPPSPHHPRTHPDLHLHRYRRHNDFSALKVVVKFPNVKLLVTFIVDLGGSILGDISNTCGSGRIQLKPWGEEGRHSSFGVAERGPEHRQGWVLKPKSVGSNGGRHVTQVIQTILNLIHGFGEIMMMTTWKLDDFLRLHLRAFPKRDTIAGEFWLFSSVKGMTVWLYKGLCEHIGACFYTYAQVWQEWLCPFFCELSHKPREAIIPIPKPEKRVRSRAITSEEMGDLLRNQKRNGMRGFHLQTLVHWICLSFVHPLDTCIARPCEIVG